MGPLISVWTWTMSSGSRTMSSRTVSVVMRWWRRRMMSSRTMSVVKRWRRR